MASKKALLIGINYKGTSSELSGCINDVVNMNTFLSQHGYKDIVVLTDDTPTKPTRKNIISAILDLLDTGEEHLFLHYSGHGSWERDKNRDEQDGRDESIVPLDYRSAGMITDDQLRGLLTFMSPKSSMVAVLDCCHAGTGMDLGWSLRETTRIQKQHVGGRMAIKKVRRKVQGRIVWKREKVRVGGQIVQKKITEWISSKDRHYDDTPGQVIMLAGCQDKQYSADAYEERQFQGAMTFCLLKALESGAAKTAVDLLTVTRKLLKDHGYTQVANLTSGRAIGPETPITF